MKDNFSVCLHAVSTAGTRAFSMTKHPHFLVIFNSLYSPLASVPSCLKKKKKKKVMKRNRAAPSAKFRPTPLALRHRIFQMLKSYPCHPCPIFLNTAVSGEPLLKRDPSCGQRVGRKHLQQVPPDDARSSALCAGARVGVGEAAGVALTQEQGAPCLLSDWRFRRQNKDRTKLFATIFLP